MRPPPEIAALVQYAPGTEHIDSGAVTANICRAGLIPQLAELCARIAQNQDFALDSYIPEEYRESLASALSEAGFFIAGVSLRGSRAQAWTRQRPPFAQYEAYMNELARRSRIDEAAYLAANPDVARAVAEGKVPSAQFHYWAFGRREKRKLKAE